MSQNSELRQSFIRFAVEAGVLSFGEFVTKAGRTSPYFFNAGKFADGALLGQVAQFYAKTLLDSGVEFDMLFGPAYKGITLASATAVALAGMGRNVGFAYNRKEAKDHGEGGSLVGAKLQGRVIIVDDVISAGTSVRESVECGGCHAGRRADPDGSDGTQRKCCRHRRALGGAGCAGSIRHAGCVDCQPG